MNVSNVNGFVAPIAQPKPTVPVEAKLPEERIYAKNEKREITELSDMATLKVSKEVQEGKIEAYKAGMENANQIQKSYNTSEDIDTTNSVKMYMEFSQDVKKAEGIQTYINNQII